MLLLAECLVTCIPDNPSKIHCLFFFFCIETLYFLKELLSEQCGILQAFLAVSKDIKYSYIQHSALNLHYSLIFSWSPMWAFCNSLPAPTPTQSARFTVFKVAFPGGEGLMGSSTGTEVRKLKISELEALSTLQETAMLLKHQQCL